MSRNAALYVALRTAAILLRLIPDRAAHALADFAGKVAYFGATQVRRNVLENLAVVLETVPEDPALTPYAKETFRTDAKNWVDTLRIRRTSFDRIEHDVTVDHFERIESALAEGRGLVLVTLHVGNFDLVGQLLAARGYRLTVPVERMEPARLFNFLLSLRSSKGINTVPLDHAPREMVRTLRAGDIVGVAGDRLIGARGGIAVPFFNRPTLLPYGPVSLARRMNSPLLIGVGVRRPDDSFLGHVMGPIAMVRTEDGDADDRENLERLAREMEGLIRAYPGQWLNFSRMWPSADSHSQAGSIRHQTEAAV